MKPLKIAFYGKGGIGKSTVAGNCAAVFAAAGLKVMQIGCDPKADSTLSLRNGKPMPTVLDLIRTRQGSFTLDDMVHIGENGVICLEAGGPEPGVGCAGRGIIAALEKLQEKGAYERFQPDVVLYDVLGDVVCGGFSMPMRGGYADQVCIVTSGENMSIYAAANIAMAVKRFKGRGYAALGGFILNARNVPDEEAKVRQLSEDFHSSILGTISRSPEIQQAEDLHKPAVLAFPDSPAAQQFRKLAETLLRDTGKKIC
ncbi:MAG: AAA family ATPase [Lentisphaeria bacterium]|nr:AAA family ATPase [Lentisphaeria bacterium]